MRSTITFFLACILTTTSCHSVKKTSRLPAGQSGSDSAYNIKCSEFQNLLEENQPKSIEQALGVLTENRPKFMSQYTVAYDSKSLHGSSFENPRILLYGGDAKTVISFNGDPSQSGFERIEMMCFNDQNKTFEFVDIAFPGEAKNEVALRDLTKKERKQPFVISDNHEAQRNCKACHQSPSRPNWHPYNLWPGFCGSDDDEYNKSRAFPSRGMSPKVNRGAGPNYTDRRQVETKGCDDFYSDNFKKGRYKYLSAFDKRGFDTDPNFQLGRLLKVLNGERIVAELKRKGHPVEAVKYQIAEALFCNFPDYRKDTPNRKDGIRTYLETLPAKPYSTNAMDFFNREIGNQRYRLSLVQSRLGKDSISLSGYNTLDGKEEKIMQDHFGIYPKTPIDKAAFENTAYRFLEIDQVAKVHEIVAPLGFDVRNWSMTTGGGYTHSDGLDGIAGTTFQMMIEKPFIRSFLSDEVEIIKNMETIQNAIEKQYSAKPIPSNQPYKPEFDLVKRVPELRQEMCDIVRPKAAKERDRSAPTAGKVEGGLSRQRGAVQ